MFIQHKSSESQDLFIYFHMYGKYLSLMATWNRMLEQNTSWVYKHGTCDRRSKAWNCSSEVPGFALPENLVVDVFLFRRFVVVFREIRKKQHAASTVLWKMYAYNTYVVYTHKFTVYWHRVFLSLYLPAWKSEDYVIHPKHFQHKPLWISQINFQFPPTPRLPKW